MPNISRIEENDEKCETDDNEDNIFKRNKRQNKLKNSSKTLLLNCKLGE